MATIQIYSKRVFKFTNQNKPINPEDLLKAVSGDPGAMKSNSMHFTTTPYEVQRAPAWVKQDPLFAWGVKDGDLMELAENSPRAAVVAEDKLNRKEEERKAGKPAEDEEDEDNISSDSSNSDDSEEEKEVTVDDVSNSKLNRMTKQELVLHAKERHDIDLDPADAKPVLIEKILTEQNKR